MCTTAPCSLMIKFFIVLIANCCFDHYQFHSVQKKKHNTNAGEYDCSVIKATASVSSITTTTTIGVVKTDASCSQNKQNDYNSLAMCIRDIYWKTCISYRSVSSVSTLPGVYNSRKEKSLQLRIHMGCVTSVLTCQILSNF